MKAIQALLLVAASSTCAVAQTSSRSRCLQGKRIDRLEAKVPRCKNVEVDLDSATLIKADKKIENTPVKAAVLGEAYIEREKGDKPQTFVCVLGEKGKVLLALFSNQ